MTNHSLRSLPTGIWVLGFASLFMDLSSELVHALLPLYLVGSLGASVALVGIIEGIAEATAAITKLFSGALSDWMRRRKFLLVLGYGLAACTKPIFPLAQSIGWVVAARFIDRVGKGIRGAPRDALVADITPPQQRGAAYGLRQSLDSVGALLGPLAAILLMLAFDNHVPSALWVAVIPACITVFLLIVFLREPAPEQMTFSAQKPLHWCDARRLSAAYWGIIVLGAVFTLARFSEAFLILQAQQTGFALAWVPGVMILMNVTYALGAYPAGLLADRGGDRALLVGGLLLLVVADVVLAMSNGIVLTLLGAALWGVHMALTQGLLAKLVADRAPADLRGTAFGIFNLVSGVVLLLASVLAGGLWSTYGAAATFYAGALFAVLAAVGLLMFTRPHIPA